MFKNFRQVLLIKFLIEVSVFLCFNGRDMKTIFISSFHGVVARNILMTPVLKTLQEQTRVVILSPAFKKEYFSKVFASPKIEIMGIGHKLTRVDLFFRSWALAASKTRGLYIKHRSKFFQDGNLFSFLGGVLPPAFRCRLAFRFLAFAFGQPIIFRQAKWRLQRFI